MNMLKLLTNHLLWVTVSVLLLGSLPVFAQCPSGQISGNAFQDFNFDGIDNDNGLGVPSVRVFAFDATGVKDSADTDASGNYALTGLTDGVKYRIEFHPLLPAQNGLQSGFEGANAGTTVQFVVSPNCTINQGFALPSEYCLGMPNIVVACYINGDPNVGGSSGTAAALIGVPYMASGTGQTANTEVVDAAQIGTCWGISLQRETQTLFTSTVLRRHSGLGPAGSGGIYAIDINNLNAPVQKPTIDLAALGIPTGADPRASEPLPADALVPNYDSTAFPLVGKMALGAMDISEDGKYLYVMNLFNRTLYRIFVNNPYQAPTAADVTAYPLSNPGCGNDNDWRPWAVKVYRGEVYVGITCTAETSQDPSELHAFIKKLNAGGGFDPVFDFPLDYVKGRTIFNEPMAQWNPWSNDWDQLYASGNGNYPQPILTDLKFDIDGAMIISFLDRTAMQGGYLNYGPGVQYTVLLTTFSSGDLLRACKTNTGWAIEGSVAGCQTPNGAGNMNGPGGSEYYWEETWENGVFNAGTPFIIHYETALGATTLVPGKRETVATVFDPLNYNTGGLAWFDNQTGEMKQAYEIYPPLFGYAGKSAGLSDVEVACGAAPLEKGNYVWIDYDKDGVQDPSEPPIAGVNVSLYQVVNNQCDELATVQTDAKGEYYFNANTPGLDSLIPNTDYYIVVGDAGQFNTTTTLLFDTLVLTVANTGAWYNPNINDSDGELTGGPACFNNLPHVKVTTGSSGHVDHTCDFGFYLKECDLVLSPATFTNETCKGKSDGTITITATATQPLEYQLNMAPFSSQSMWTGLPPGTYTITVQVVGDADCSESVVVVIQPGIDINPPSATTSLTICQNDNLPPAQGLTATCGTCPPGSTGQVTWWTAATGGTKVFTGVLFNPVVNGNVSTATPGSTTFYAQCECGPCESSRLPATITVLPKNAPSATGNFTICQNDNIPAGQGLTASCAPCPPGVTGQVTWWTAATGGTMVFTGDVFNPLTNGGVNNAMPGTYTFYAQCECGPCFGARGAATLTILPKSAPSTTTNLTICQNDNIPAGQGLTATCEPCPPGFTGQVTWWTAAVGGTKVFTGDVFNPLTNGGVNNAVPGTYTFYAQCECGPCASTRAAATLTILPKNTPSATGSLTICQNDNIPAGQGLTATCAPCPPGVMGQVTWWTAATGGTKVFTGDVFNPLTNGGINSNVPGTYTFYAQCECGPCFGNRLAATLTILPRSTPSATTNLTICQNDNIPAGQGLTATCAPCPPGVLGQITWWTAATGGTKVFTGDVFNPLTNGGVNNAVPGTYTFYAQCECGPCFGSRVSATLTILPRNTPSATGSLEICQNDNIPAGQGLTATCAPCPPGVMGQITWWSAQTGGTLLFTGDVFNPIANGNVDPNVPGLYTFFAQCECGPCFGDRMAAKLRIWPSPEPDITGEANPCPGSTHTYTTPLHPGSSYVWTLSGGGTIVSQNANQITIQWTGANGSTWQLSVKETDIHGCMKTDILEVCIRNTYLVCNDVVNVSLGDMCKAVIHPDAVLEGTYKTYEGLIVTITPVTPGGMAMHDTIMGKGMYNYMVTEPCIGNSCWGKINAEDKLPPVINCQPLSYPCTYTDTSVVLPNVANMPTFAIPGGGIGGVVINDNCGIVKVWYTDHWEDVNCTDYFGVVSAILFRKWYAQDMSGNTAECVQEIRFIREAVTNVVFPKDTIVDCTAANTNPLNTGLPTIAGLPLLPSATSYSFCEINTSYTDQVLDVCGATKKILRTWHIINWCMPLNQNNPNIPYNPITHLQVIKVSDASGPILNCPSNITVSTDQLTCTATVDLPDVIAEDACSYLAHAQAHSITGNINGSFTDFPGNNHWMPDTLVHFGTVAGFPLGNNMITYTVSDECGNSSFCTFRITVEDDTPPSPVCVSNTKISLGADGMAFANAAVFNKASFDNCGDVWFKVRRMDGSPCTSPNNNFFQDQVKFCCGDLNDSVMVILRVYDQEPSTGAVGQSHLNGHYNDCMVRVIVEDKLKPVCTAPANVTVNCDAFDPSLWAYGQAIGTDNCAIAGQTVALGYENFDTICNRGTLERVFTVTDHVGNSAKCTQYVTVLYRTNYSVKFPDDVTINQCNGSGNYGEPVFVGKDCELSAVSYTDQIFTVVPDACYKIIRTWKVLDWCNFSPNYQPLTVTNPNNSDLGPTVFATDNNKGYFQYVQVIKVQDNEKPVITDCPVAPVIFQDLSQNDLNWYNGPSYWDATHSSHNLCDGPAPLTITATDACSGDNVEISYQIYMDLDGNGTYETIRQSGQTGAPLLTFSNVNNTKKATVSSAFQFPYGTHKVIWKVKDGCGNETTCQYNFSVVDGKKPTVVCINGLSANIMQTKMVTLWASDFVQYSADNCTPTDQLVYAIRRSGTGTGFPLDANGQPLTSVSFTCNDLGTQTVEVWAKDAAGNADYCETYLLIQDNMGSCSSTMATVSGALRTEDVENVENAYVKVTGANNALPTPGIFTSSDGTYNFHALPFGDDYTITPEKDINWLNGVSTYDLLLITKHITNNQPFNSPFKIIAADANRSNTVTTYDILQLRKVILGITDDVPGNTSWRFVPKNFTFQNPANPFETTFPEAITFADMTHSVYGGDFMAVKVGDVNNSAQPNQLTAADDRTIAGEMVFDLDEQQIETGKIYSVAFKSSDLARVLGYQFTLTFNPDALEFVALEPANLPELSRDNFGLSLLAEGLITSSWNGIAPAGINDVFTLTFRAKTAGKLSDFIGLSNKATQTEAYNLASELFDVALRFNGATGSATHGVGFELYQNEPNPFADKTVFGFYLPGDSKTTLSIIDVNGKILHTVQGEFTKGYNRIELNRNALHSVSGVLIYRLESSFGNDQKKMILAH